ncbi:MAG: SPFH domain-containing protein [Fimbriimonadaceae bacterium]
MIRFFKGQPSEYVIQYVGGKIKKQGQGIAFSYLKFKTSIVVVPTTSTDSMFVFHDMTRNFQEVAVQGQFTFRVKNPQVVAAQLNFGIDLRDRSYQTTDPEMVPKRITNAIQAKVHDQIQARSLEESIRDSESIAGEVMVAVTNHPTLAELGVEIIAVHIQSIRPTPEVGKALEAEYRETLMRKADEAIYTRRAAAVEEERKIKEKELATDVALEEQRRSLLELQGQNALQDAQQRSEAMAIDSEAKANALKQELAAFKSIDPRVLAAMGFRDLAKKGADNLTITTEVLSALMNGKNA